MQATAVVYVALLAVVGCNAAEEAVAVDELVEEPGSGLEAAPLEDEAPGAAVGAAPAKESRLGGKAAARSRFPAAVAGYNRFYPGYSPDYYYPRSYPGPGYYPAYPSNYYPPVVYPTSGYPPVSYPQNNYPPVNYPTPYPSYYPYDYVPYGSGVNEYSARHERA